MNKETFFEVVRWTVFAVVVGILLITGIVLLRRGVLEGAENRCSELGERLGYETELISGYCYIKVRSGLKVREDLVLDFLPVIDCGKGD